jgi:hypothetical protein
MDEEGDFESSCIISIKQHCADHFLVIHRASAPDASWPFEL